MRFLQKNKISKTILVISDLHLGAGKFVKGRYNLLEDFHSDNELIEFLEFFSRDEYATRPVELVINGDFLDFLAVPYVEFFDDEYWSEEAALEKLKMVVEAHQGVFHALKEFVRAKNKKLVYIIGNHDAELVFPSLQEFFLNLFDEQIRPKVSVLCSFSEEYCPFPGVVIKHGHQSEMAHYMEDEHAMMTTAEGRNFFIPPWGSYYVTRVINKFKMEKDYINVVKPIRKLLINGLIYDTLFILRFIFATCYYFIMVRFIHLYKLEKNWKKLFEYARQELKLFHYYEELISRYFEENERVKVLIEGHNHRPCFHPFAEGPVYINTGTWVKMFNLDFQRQSNTDSLPFAQIDINDDDEEKLIQSKGDSFFNQVDVGLNVWKGRSQRPFQEFS